MVFSPKNFSWAVWFHRFRLINVFLMVALFKGSQFMLSVWNDPFFRQNHWFKSLQLVGGYCTIYLFGNVALYSSQLGVMGQISSLKQSVMIPPHHRKMQKWEQGTSLLPGVSMLTGTTLPRVGSSPGRTGTEFCVPWWDGRDGWGDDPCLSDVTFVPHCFHSPDLIAVSNCPMLSTLESFQKVLHSVWFYSDTRSCWSWLWWGESSRQICCRVFCFSAFWTWKDSLTWQEQVDKEPR